MIFGIVNVKIELDLGPIKAAQNIQEFGSCRNKDPGHCPGLCCGNIAVNRKQLLRGNLRSGPNWSHASSSVFRKRETVSTSNDIRCLPSMVTFLVLSNGRGTCGQI